MAQYTITTTREQEAGLNFAFTNFGSAGQTKAQFLQERVNHLVLNPMFLDYKTSNAVALDKSIATIPAENEAAANQQIQEVIVNNGGTIVTAGPPPNPIPASIPGGAVSALGGENGHPV